MTSISAILVISEATLAAGTKRALADMPVRVLLDEASFADWNEFCERVEILGPDVLILDLGILRDSIEATMERIQKIAHPPAIVAIHTEAEAETILRVIRAGAMEYCYPPVELPLRAALERILRRKTQTAPVRGHGKTFGFLSAKGGCGATTIACHAAMALRGIMNDRVLLADFDFSGGMVAFLLKCDGTYSVVQAMQNSHRLDESYWKALVSNGTAKLDVLTAPPIHGERIPLQVDRLAGVLQFARTVYSATVVDLGRFLTAGALAAIPEIDQVLIVTTLDVLALHQAKKIVESLLDVGYPRERIGIVLNRVTGQRDLEPEDVEKLLGVTIQSVLPEDAGALHDAYSEGKLLDEKSKLLDYITRLARRLSGVPEPAHKKRFGIFGG